MPLPKGKRAVNSKWVLKVKDLPDGGVKYKARLVAKGFSQREGIVYAETFAHVVKYKSLRMLLALANERNMEIHQLDVTTAFLYGELEEETFMNLFWITSQCPFRFRMKVASFFHRPKFLPENTDKVSDGGFKVWTPGRLPPELKLLASSSGIPLPTEACGYPSSESVPLMAAPPAAPIP